MKWSEIPLPARRYILYHTIITPLLIVWYMLPLYMYMTGYTVLEIGVFYTIVHLASIPLTYIFGKIFERISIRKGLMLIDTLDGIAYTLYGLSYGPLAPLLLFLGLLIEDFSHMLYPLYQATENILYPRDKLEEVFVWHMRLPLISQIIGYLVLGYIFGYIYNEPVHYRIAFIGFALSSVFTVYYLYRFLPPLSREERIEPEKFTFKIDREFRIILLVEALTTLAWRLAPSIVFLNYVVNVLGKTLFEAMLAEVAVSLGGLTATYLTERIGRKYASKIMFIGYLLVTLWALIMSLKPQIHLVITAYFIMELGSTLVFPYYRGWLYRKIPRDRSTTIFAAIGSYRRVIGLITPFIAGLLASINPVLPYNVSLVLFLVTGIILYRVYHG